MARTDHSDDISALRRKAVDERDEVRALVLGTAADILELHDETALSLDKWENARSLVESLIGHPINENEV